MVLKRILTAAKRLISGEKKAALKEASAKASAPKAKSQAEGPAPEPVSAPRPQGRRAPAEGGAPRRSEPKSGPSEARPPRAPRPEGERPSRAPRPEGDRGPRDSRRSRGGSGGGGGGRGRDGAPRGGDRDEPVSEYRPQARTIPDRVELEADSPFRALGLSEDVNAGIKLSGYTQPTPIQEQTIPLILQGKDLAGSAQTGTGKTAAFVLPILTKLKTPGKLRCLILEPTRELADQVRNNLETHAAYTGLRHTAIFGGVKHGPQREAIRKGLDILVATPGRLLDHVEAGDLSLQDIEVLVLDEVDRMIDIGFLPQVRRVIKLCPVERQTLLFSATIPEEIAMIAKLALKDPVRIEIGIKRSVADTITHGLYPVDSTQKFDMLLKLLEKTDYKSVIVFCRTRAGTDRIWEWLKAHGHNVGVMHSDRSQGQRLEALKGFKEGKYSVLVATDLAARGLDIASVTHVINYDVPEHAEDYVHRIGRTGRASKDGDAFTLYTPNDMAHVDAIERFLARPIDCVRVEGFNYDPEPTYLFQRKAPPVVQARNFKFRGRR